MTIETDTSTVDGARDDRVLPTAELHIRPIPPETLARVRAVGVDHYVAI